MTSDLCTCSYNSALKLTLPPPACHSDITRDSFFLRLSVWDGFFLWKIKMNKNPSEKFSFPSAAPCCSMKQHFNVIKRAVANCLSIKTQQVYLQWIQVNSNFSMRRRVICINQSAVTSMPSIKETDAAQTKMYS